jgi:hypothetical protein
MTMTDEEVLPTEGEEPEPDSTVDVLRSWGLSGEPVTWAATSMQPAIAIIRLANTGFSDEAAVQDVLDATYGDGTYAAADVMLAHPVTAAFTAAPGEIDPEVDPTPYAGVVHVDLADDEDLGLPDAQVTYDFGDGTATAHDAYGWDHGYTSPGTYTITCTIPVAGVQYSTAQEYAVEPVEEAEPVLAVEYQGRPTVLEDPENPSEEPPMGNAFPNEPVNPSEPEEPEEGEEEPVPEDEPYDPSAHTVDEVLAYAAEHPDEVEVIAAAEEAGKNRVGILDKL